MQVTYRSRGLRLSVCESSGGDREGRGSRITPNLQSCRKIGVMIDGKSSSMVEESEPGDVVGGPNMYT